MATQTLERPRTVVTALFRGRFPSVTRFKGRRVRGESSVAEGAALEITL